MDQATSQRISSSIVDMVFFFILGLLGWHGVIKEVSLVSLLLLYAQARFNIAAQKQNANAVVAAASSSGSNSTRPPNDGQGGSGVTGQMQSPAYKSSPRRYQEIIDTVPTREDSYPTPPTGSKPPTTVTDRVPRPDKKKDPRQEERLSITSSPLVHFWHVITGRDSHLFFLVLVAFVVFDTLR